jgi:type IV pilus assembly protein PilA
MKKQGFTLIELMVVIVIMGILAAVAVPKLFGMIAKSKASEVGPAAGTYVKLQQAYFSESNQAGGWQLIGYMAPGTNSATTNFSYNPGDIAVGTSDALAQAKVGWQAGNSVNLNECAGGANGTPNYHWTVTLSLSSATNNGNADVAFAASAGDAGCVALTPTFDKIGK